MIDCCVRMRRRVFCATCAEEHEMIGDSVFRSTRKSGEVGGETAEQGKAAELRLALNAEHRRETGKDS